MKNYPEQIKMLKELRDSKSISESEYQDMLEILLKELEEQNEQLKEQANNSTKQTTIPNKTPTEDFIPFSGAINSEAEIATLLVKSKSLIQATKIYSLLYGCFLIGIFIFWHQLLSQEGFWEQFVLFSLLVFLLGTIYESKFTASVYENFSALLNLSIYSKRKLYEKLHVDDPIYLYISDARNADAQRVLNKIIQYFFLYRFGIVIVYKILVNTFIDRILLLEKLLFFEGLSRSGNLFYYELAILIGIKVYFVIKSLRSGESFKNELKSSFSKEETRKISSQAPDTQYFFPNEQHSYFGPFSRKQVKHFIGLKLILDEDAIKNGYGTTVEKVQFVQ
jgi:hypothetical protein